MFGRVPFARALTRVSIAMALCSTGVIATAVPAHAVTSCTASTISAAGPVMPGPFAGYTMNHGAYTDVQATFNVPRLTGSVAPPMNAGISLNIGVSKTHPRISALLNTDNAGGRQYTDVEFIVYTPSRTWWSLEAPGFRNLVDPGTTVSMHLTQDFAGHIALHVHNQTNGRDCRVDISRPGTSPDGHASVGVERVKTTKWTAGFPRFSTINFSGAEVAAPSLGWKTLAQVSHQAVTMKNGSTVLAKPGALGGFGTTFPMTSVAGANFVG